MVLGEFPQKEIEQMASSFKLMNFYIESIKDWNVDETDATIINLALERLLEDLEDEEKDNNVVFCKECLIIQYLELEKEE